MNKALNSVFITLPVRIQ